MTWEKEKGEIVRHTHHQTQLEGVCFLPKNHNESNLTYDLVLICHAWAGRDSHALEMAHKLSTLGFISLALDLYGEGVVGQSVEENSQRMRPFMEDRSFLADRLESWVQRAKDLFPKRRVHAMGFCFGGLCVLDMARANMGVHRVASFHGLFESTPGYLDLKTPIHPEILILHGYKDPMATPEQLLALGQELDRRKAQWILECYGTSFHAFTNPLANDPRLGAFYNPLSAKMAFESAVRFFHS